MLSLQQAYEIRESIRAYLHATFTFRDPRVSEAFGRFVGHEQAEGMFRGPYVTLRLPFLKAEEGMDIPLEIRPPFTPFRHQLKAFRRLSGADGQGPGPTLLTTGTGSGKTESFLYPILDHCHRQPGPGIKAIILYPMNALATDQAGRLARAIWTDERLRGRVKAGLLIGMGKRDRKKYPMDMGEDHIIENRERIRTDPPDILLTNFKMLDYALMRGEFHELWLANFAAPETLRFLVLDELHTYDGAQGSDVANLIRRLKAKLGIAEGVLCPVGTSATIDSGPGSRARLAEYASRLFGEEVGEEAVIVEERVEPEAFFDQSVEPGDFLPKEAFLLSRLNRRLDYRAYLEAQATAWQISRPEDRAALRAQLMELLVVRQLVDLCLPGPRTIDELCRELAYRNAKFRQYAEMDPATGLSPRRESLLGLIALLAHATESAGATATPMLQVQVHLWIREFSGVLRLLQEQPAFVWRDHLRPGQKGAPPWYCRECGASGLLVVRTDTSSRLVVAYQEVYQKYFGNHKHLWFAAFGQAEDLLHPDYQPTERQEAFLDPETLQLSDRPGEGLLPILLVKRLDGERNDHVCPACNGRNTLAIIGTRNATLSAVAASQVLSSDLDPAPEPERKLLGFANGVQDAAHGAGFIQARTYNFTFRAGIQRVLNELGDEPDLATFQEAFIRFWKGHADDRGAAHLEAYLYKFFPSDHLGDVGIERYRTGPSAFRPLLVEEFDRRVTWEIASEFGYNARIGRTLEKSGASAAWFEPERLQRVYGLMAPWLRDNAMASIDEKSFLVFLTQVLHRVRYRGGIDHPYLHRFRTEKSSYYHLTQNVNKAFFLMRNFGRRTRLPRMVSDEARPNSVFDGTNTGVSSWFHTHFRKSFPLAPSHQDAVREFYSLLLETLSSEQTDIFDAKYGQEARNFCLRPEAVRLTTRVVEYRCDRCAHQIQTGVSGTDISGGPCMEYRCTGSYLRPIEGPVGNYYRDVYNRRVLPRVYAADHTGLLDRQVRERIEMDFRRRPHFHSLNTLIATSTLEMGIDIGDLNVTMNTSMPPLPANFLQRIGRAGRKSGSALIVNLCGAEPHDLYFFARPGEMMEGQVHTPGCYLEAEEILGRHFTAFCFDSWATADPIENHIPPMVRHLQLLSTDVLAPSFFINRFIRFVLERSGQLTDAFRAAYRREVPEEVFARLASGLENGLFANKLQRVFLRLQVELRDLLEKRRGIKEDIGLRGLKGEDEEFKDLMAEHRNLNASMKLIEKRMVLEHLTNVGVLPNYAFPETGVSLFARIAPHKPREHEGPALHHDLEIVRPAVQAMSELIPDNFFYSQGYRMQVRGIEVSNWQEDVIERRFCSNCDYLTEEEPGPAGPCPKCGDHSFMAVENGRPMLRLSAVRSYDREEEARLNDSSEERDSILPLRSGHVRLDQALCLGSWAMEKIPFGVEYVREMRLADVVGGLQTDIPSRSHAVTINGQLMPRHGFITCRTCGRSSARLRKNHSATPKEAADYHERYCRHRGIPYQPGDPHFGELFLYREMKTEALKLLLPVQEFESEETIALFQAGMEIGLRKFYQGNPDHLKLRPYSEFNPQTGKKDRYLLLYDTIPGGTGYLSRLFEPQAFIRVLEEAHKVFRDCSCQLEGLDGCYQCIYTFGNQRQQKHLSRERAEKLLGRILAASSSWHRSEDGLSAVASSGRIEESELEERFVEVLRRHAEDNPGMEYKEENIDGVVHYRLIFKVHRQDRTYLVRPQVRLGASEGVPLTTRPDFLVVPEGSQTWQGPRWEGLAVFLDGYTYHATPENPRFASDLAQRRAVGASGRYLTWTLTWQDLSLFLAEGAKGQDELAELEKTAAMTRERFHNHPRHPNMKPVQASCRNAMDRLLALLKDPEVFEADLSGYLCGFYREGVRDAMEVSQVLDYLAGQEVEQAVGARPGPGKWFGLEGINPGSSLVPWRGAGSWEGLAFRSAVAGEVDGFLPLGEWQAFWRRWNLLQWFDEPLETGKEHGGEEKKDTVFDEEVFTYFDAVYHPIVRFCMEHGIAFDRDGTFVLMDGEVVLAEAVMGFRDRNLVIGPMDEENAAVFRHHGFAVDEPDNFDTKLLFP